MPTGYKHTEEHKQSIRGDNNPAKRPEVRAKISRNRKGKDKGYRSEEHKKKIGLAVKGEKNGMYGRKHTEKTRRIQSEIQKALYKNGRNTGMLGKRHTEATKKKMSLHMLGDKNPTKRLEVRRKISKALRGNTHGPKRFPFRDTSIEVRLQTILTENKIKFEKHYPILGQPDIFIKPNVCIFADGCYWHKCPDCGFKDKLKTKKDFEITNKLKSQGYVVIRLWEHEINNSLLNCLAKIKCQTIKL
jgi:DNA mismatch endonuclease (patch repair protein)